MGMPIECYLWIYANGHAMGRAITWVVKNEEDFPKGPIPLIWRVALSLISWYIGMMGILFVYLNKVYGIQF